MKNNVGNTNTFTLLTLSQRIARTMLSAILTIVISTETVIPMAWLFVLSVIAFYTLVTGFLGQDPLLKLLKQSNEQLPDQKLSFAAQLECATFGAICVTVGILYRNSDSILLNILPFLGIYPILICAIKYDLLAYLLQSYRRSMATRDTE